MTSNIKAKREQKTIYYGHDLIIVLYYEFADKKTDFENITNDMRNESINNIVRDDTKSKKLHKRVQSLIDEGYATIGEHEITLTHSGMGLRNKLINSKKKPEPKTSISLNFSTRERLNQFKKNYNYDNVGDAIEIMLDIAILRLEKDKRGEIYD